MPSSEDFFKRLGDARGKLDPETLQQIMEIVPPEFVNDVLAIAMDRRVQAGVMQVRDAVAKSQGISLGLASSLPSALAELREALEEAVAGAEETMSSIDPQRIADLKGHLPAVAKGLAKAALARPEGAPARETLAAGFSQAFGRSANATPGTTTAALAVGDLYRRSQWDANPASASSPVVRLFMVASDLIVPAPYTSVTAGVVKAFADARGVAFEDELNAWARDANNHTVFSNAVSRYATAQGLDALNADAKQAATNKMVGTLETLFSGVADLWLERGATTRVNTLTTREVGKAMKAINLTGAAAIKANSGPKGRGVS